MASQPAPNAPKRARDAILTALQQTPDDLARLTKDRSAEDLLQPSRDGGWGVVEIMARMRDWEEIFLARVEATVAEDVPFLAAVDDELWPIERDYRGQDPVVILDEFRELRTKLLDVLRALPPEGWDRTATHSVHGVVTLHWLVDHICERDREQVEQARDALV